MKIQFKECDKNQHLNKIEIKIKYFCSTHTLYFLMIKYLISSFCWQKTFLCIQEK